MANVTQPLATPDRAPRGREPSSRLTLVSDAVPASADDSGQGLGLFLLFTVAVLVVTAAVGFLALLASWWVLGVVFGLHVLFTAIVGTGVFTVLRSGDPGLDGDNLLQFGDAANPQEPVQSRGRSSQTSALAA